MGTEKRGEEGDIFEVKAEIVQIGGLSAHAGRNFLLEYGLAAKGQLKQVFLVHGEEAPAQAVHEGLRAGGLEKVYYPHLRQMLAAP